MNLLNLNDVGIRPLMLLEIELDVNSAKGLYLSSYFNEQGKRSYPHFLRQAATTADSNWLSDQLQKYACFLAKHTYVRAGNVVVANVPVTANQTIAEGEINRFYIRAVCAHVIQSGKEYVEIYRAKFSEKPRPESEFLIGKMLEATQLLADLRDNPGVEAALGLAKPNSGLSVKIPA